MFDVHQKPPRIPPKIKSAPKIRQLYWCDFPKDAQLPEFWKRRPVIIISKNNKLYGRVTVIPCSTCEQEDNKYAFKLNTLINTEDKHNSYAICNNITTVAVSRLVPDKAGIKRISEIEFYKCMELVLDFLPKI